MIVVRRLVSGDEGLVFAAAPLFDHPPDPLGTRAFLADLAAYLLVAYVSGEPAGFARAHELPQIDTPRRQLFLYEIGVAATFQRRGVARALIAELLHLCTERDFDEMFVITNGSNAPAMRLYETTGGQREAADDVVFVYSTRDVDP
jgi:ribosomal protein S18 acetylase RimI-like enzyme